MDRASARNAMTTTITIIAVNVLKGRVIESEFVSGEIGVEVGVEVVGDVGVGEVDVSGIVAVCVLLHPLD